MGDDAVLRHFFSGFVRLHILYHAVKEPVYGAEITQELNRHGSARFARPSESSHEPSNAGAWHLAAFLGKGERVAGAETHSERFEIGTTNRPFQQGIERRLVADGLKHV